MYKNKPCGRQLYDDQGMCICHSKLENKDVSHFQNEIDNIFKDDTSDRLDFNRFFFPKKDWRFFRQTFHKDANFKFAEFSGIVNFWNAEFSGKANFYRTRFIGKAPFYRTKFIGKVEFERTEFSTEAIFRRAQFSDKADFYLAEFSGKANFGRAEFSGKVNFLSTFFYEGILLRNGIAKSGAHIIFDIDHLIYNYLWVKCVKRSENISRNEMWRVSADIRSFKIDKNAVVTFLKVSMEGVHLLESDISRMEFIAVEWPKTNRWHKRRTLADEVIENVRYEAIVDEIERKKKCSLIAQVYQGLQEIYINTYRYLEAGDFFVGEQEMRRKGKGKLGQYFSLNNAYRILSYYGQSMLLPLFWLFGVISIVPGLLMYGEVRINLQDKSDIVTYNWSFNISDLLFLKTDYWQTFLLNFSFMAFSRSKMHDALTEPWQLALVNIEALVVIGLVAMSLLAVRRRFKRKNF
ncbi:MAG: pentapeptide repeat-containing protein [candidate division Zixibacteria bacterium]|nr:pentapeptide repeat-containing protein [candidate division Zixibacteria bacterium]